MSEPKVEVFKSHHPDLPQYNLEELKIEIKNLLEDGSIEHGIFIGVGPKGMSMRFGSSDKDGLTMADVLWYFEKAKLQHLASNS